MWDNGRSGIIGAPTDFASQWRCRIPRRARRYLPTAALGAILIVAAIGLFDAKSLVRLWRVSKPEFAVAIIEANVWGNTVEAAATAKTVHDASQSSGLPHVTELLDASILAGLDAAVEPLLKLLKDPEWRVRWKVLKAFHRLTRHIALPENARLALLQYAHDELASFRASLDVSRAVVPNPSDEPGRLLASALAEDRANIEERVFRMLGIVCGHDRMLAVHRKLQSGESRLRADALEALAPSPGAAPPCCAPATSVSSSTTMPTASARVSRTS